MEAFLLDDDDVEQECLSLLRAKEKKEKKRRGLTSEPSAEEIGQKLEEMAMAEAAGRVFWERMKEEDGRREEGGEGEKEEEGGGLRTVEGGKKKEENGEGASRLFVRPSAATSRDCEILASIAEIESVTPYLVTLGHLVRPHIQQDLLASGFLFSSLLLLLRSPLKPPSPPPQFVFDWLLSLIAFSPNQHVPLPAFRTLSSLLSSSSSLVPLEAAVLGPSFGSRVVTHDDEETHGSDNWKMSFQRFSEILVILGASHQKIPASLSTSIADLQPYISSESIPPSEKHVSLFNLDLLIQSLSSCVRYEGIHYSLKDLTLFIRTCCQILLDPIGRHVKGSLQEAISLLLDALPNMNGPVCQELCEEICSPLVTHSHTQRLSLARDIPITSRRSRFFVASLSFLSLHRILDRLKAKVTFLDRPNVGEVTKLVHALQKKYLKGNIAPVDLCSALEFVDLLIHKESLVGSKDTSDFKVFLETIKELRQVLPYSVKSFSSHFSYHRESVMMQPIWKLLR